jgi:hypothetical protein
MIIIMVVMMMMMMIIPHETLLNLLLCPGIQLILGTLHISKQQTDSYTNETKTTLLHEL